MLEADNAADVAPRQARSGYESWPPSRKCWAEVPDHGLAVRRPAGLRPGLTIHVLGHQCCCANRNEQLQLAVLAGAGDSPRVERGRVVGRASTAALRLGAAGAGFGGRLLPDDDPFLRAEFMEAHASRWAEGRAECRAETYVEVVLQVFKTRRLPVSVALPRRLAGTGGRLQRDSVCCRRCECRDAADLLRLLLARS